MATEDGDHTHQELLSQDAQREGDLVQRQTSREQGARRPSGSKKLCGKCGLALEGQFVRALDNTFHLECFTCYECGKIVASKFFPHPEQEGTQQHALCETDYFRRLGLLCHACGGALRGSYITALDRKYHIEHFTCSICPTVFGASDSYYEHEGNVYCHYHYSTRFAQKCNGCQTAILKQFVEIFRNGQKQHWHPECYMIHKYWNVRLASSTDASDPGTLRGSDEAATEVERRRVRQDEEQIEEKVLWIWRTLSSYEEKSASCISDMLLHVSNGAYVEGVMSAKKFIVHVELLFGAADKLDMLVIEKTGKGLSYSREAKLLCKKVVAFFQLLAQSQDTGVRRLGVTQELLSLVTGLAHYLKLLIRICLQGALKLERDAGNKEGLQLFLDQINLLESQLERDDGTENLDNTNYVNLSADTCPVCSKPVEDRCYRLGDQVFHHQCMRCDKCERDLNGDLQNALLDTRDGRIRCNRCADQKFAAPRSFVAITRLQQYVHLLRVAHARLLATLRTSGALPHTSEDPNLDKYDSNAGRRMADPPITVPHMLRSDARSKSYTGKGPLEGQSSGYEQALGDIRRMRSTRLEKQLSTAQHRGRTSRIIDGPNGIRSESADEPSTEPHSGLSLLQPNDRGEPGISQLGFNATDSIHLDDIQRLVAAEQAREHRPNANKYARGGLAQQEPKLKMMSAHRRDTSGGNELDKLGPEGHRPKRYFSELSALEYFIVRHVAVLSMEPLLEGFFNQEELLDLIETRKATFWGKFGKAFQQKEKPKPSRKKGIFGIPLEALVERDGEECSDGVGPGALKVPAIVQDAVSAMRTMDMSMEGVFRKNGNIKKLREMAEAMDAKGSSEAVDLNGESPVQVAALLKKFLRELPDPILTFKLHKLFVTSQKIGDEQKQRRILHLSCCLLPKSHRDTMEVLFNFLNWAASFAAVDEESGSKMDVHNLATVIAPNILYSTAKEAGPEESFLGIEAVNQLIQFNDTMCEVPEDVQSILNDSSLFSGSADLTTKEILKRYNELGKQTPNPRAEPPPTHSSHGSTPAIPRVEEAPASATGVRPTQSGSPFIAGGNQDHGSPPIPIPSSNGFYHSPGPAGSQNSFGSMGGGPRGPRPGGAQAQGQGSLPYLNGMNIT